MSETTVTLSRREGQLSSLMGLIRYINSKQHVVKRGNMKMSRALYSIADLTNRTGWAASTIRSLLGTLYGRGLVTPEAHGAIYWRATVAKEREAL